jgi:23S rRNA pseudouridine1911/1915/1917 synthase
MPRLIEHLRASGLSNKEANDLLDTGKVFYCGIPTADRGREVDTSRVVINRGAPRIQPGRDIAIIHRDDHLIVLWKPSGMMSVAATGRRGEKNVIGVVRRIFGDAFPVHRLDEETSGLMMVALTRECQEAVKEILFKHSVERGYLAIVRGLFPEEPCTMRTLMVRNRGDGLRGSLADGDEDGAREAVTHLKLLEHIGKKTSLVEARLETGRTHQVRIHLSEKGFPVLGDFLYAPTNIARAAPRLALHAFKLRIRHPFTDEELAFQTTLADDLEVLRRSISRSRSK